MQCHICQKLAQPFQDEKHQATYYFCHGCAYIFKDPQYYWSMKAQKERYDLHENSEESAGYRAYFQRFLDFLLPHVGGVKRALDFGCGRSMLLSKMLQEQHIVCDAYDPLYHPEGLDEEKRYGLIVSTEVFEHLSQPKEVFATLVTQLEEGGYLAIQTQFHPNEVEAFKTWYYPNDPTHIVFFTPKSFICLAQQYGMKYITDNGRNMVLLQKP